MLIIMFFIVYYSEPL